MRNVCSSSIIAGNERSLTASHQRNNQECIDFSLEGAIRAVLILLPVSLDQGWWFVLNELKNFFK